MGILSNNNLNGANDILQDFYFPTSKKALIIFVRNPELGRCKTRLAKAIGDVAALEVYKLLLQHTANISKNVDADKYVFYSETIQNNDLWDEPIFRKKLQKGLDLGERMCHAFQALFEMGYEKVAIIGSDLIDLDTKTIDLAFSQLDHFDYVIGPALDGGYYLLGMNHLYLKIFENKHWGTDTVLADTLNDLKNTSVFHLKELNDIDTFDDLKQHRQFQKFYSNQHDQTY
ncbi:MAG TPA: TIGR04282 family arsenosugar biosynthesis glycosyltransferase [Aquaticitalea sp.]|nr:TIGR04282 family arsenosugar biosynthesis glycosyltransferase [Aquaticitalea sp.]HNU59441.1 TIGR04282 family arsenosugar biosynthesis glycosyltransferase [Aquaticitalea sp.]